MELIDEPQFLVVHTKLLMVIVEVVRKLPIQNLLPIFATQEFPQSFLEMVLGYGRVQEVIDE